MPSSSPARLQHRVLQPLSNPPLALALCAWRDAPIRDAVATAAALGFRAVQLDATHPQGRPRTLDRSARRDLAAVLRRSQLECAGLDLWLPPEHLTPGPGVERATEAVVHAIELVRELAGLVTSHPIVSLALPDEVSSEALAAIDASALRHEVRVADHAWPARDSDCLGLDPALPIMAGQSAAKAATTLGPRLATARLSDAGVSGRVAVGSAGGRLDTSAYAAALSISAPHIPVVADVRSLNDPRTAAAAALRTWMSVTEPYQTFG